MTETRRPLRRWLVRAAIVWVVLAGAVFSAVTVRERTCADWRIVTSEAGTYHVELVAPDAAWPEGILTELTYRAQADAGSDGVRQGGAVCVLPDSAFDPWRIAAVLLVPAALILVAGVIPG